MCNTSLFTISGATDAAISVWKNARAADVPINPFRRPWFGSHRDRGKENRDTMRKKGEVRIAPPNYHPAERSVEILTSARQLTA